MLLPNQHPPMVSNSISLPLSLREMTFAVMKVLDINKAALSQQLNIHCSTLYRHLQGKPIRRETETKLIQLYFASVVNHPFR